MIGKTLYVNTDTNFTDFNWKIGEKVSIYTDIMNGQGLLGIGIIEKYLEEPNTKLAFIRKEMPSDKQEVWTPRKCRIRVVGLNPKGLWHNLVVGECYTRDIAHPYRIGITSASYKKIKPIEKYPRIRMDNFEIVPGWGQCF